jgi:dihydroxyacid dehydratase/phosphogluconate dehydratase
VPEQSAGDTRRRQSQTLLEGVARAPARSYLRNIGYSPEDLRRPIVGVFHSWTDTSTPAAAMALARLDRPGVVGYSGTVLPGRFQGRAVLARIADEQAADGAAERLPAGAGPERGGH